ncbi:MAG TPA: Gfo/Idh/MocA family oxidoreductase [Calditerricola sp.]
MIRVAVIGAGQWGKNLVRTFYELGCLAAVADASPTIQEQVKQAYPEVPVYADYRPLLERPDIPAVAIATPAHTHYAVAREALEAGKDVFVEKPLTLSVEEAELLDELARQTGRILMVGHLLLYQPAIRWIKQYLASGELGDVVSLHQQRLKLGRVRTVENALWSLGVHDIAVLLDLIGKEPQRVVAVGQRVLQPAIEDDVHLHLTFSGGVQAHLHTSWLWPTPVRKLVIVGTEGALEFDEIAQRVVLHRKGIDAHLQAWDKGSEVVFEGQDEPLRIECEHFLSCVKTRQEPLSPARQGVAVLRVLEEASCQLAERREGQ